MFHWICDNGTFEIEDPKTLSVLSVSLYKWWLNGNTTGSGTYCEWEYKEKHIYQVFKKKKTENQVKFKQLQRKDKNNTSI